MLHVLGRFLESRLLFPPPLYLLLANSVYAAIGRAQFGTALVFFWRLLAEIFIALTGQNLTRLVLTTSSVRRPHGGNAAATWPLLQHQPAGKARFALIGIPSRVPDFLVCVTETPM